MEGVAASTAAPQPCDDLSEREVVADVAGEDHVRPAEHTGIVSGDRAEQGHHAGEKLAGHLGPADPQAVNRDVMRGDAPFATTQAGTGPASRQCRTMADTASETRRET